MRPGQNNHQKRPRGRGGRKPHNMSNRTYDSNGPDVKVRGTASHIYEKYLQLARDAQSSGDRVQGESYLQHAEHYWRVLMATQPPGQPYQPQFGANGEQNYPVNGDGRPQQGYGVPGEGPQPDLSGGARPGEGGEDEGEDDGEGEDEQPRM